MQLVEKHFRERNETDPAFAIWAQEQLGFAVNDNNVKGARYALNIEATPRVNGGLESRVTLLEQRLARAEDLINQLANSRVGRTA